MRRPWMLTAGAVLAASLAGCTGVADPGPSDTGTPSTSATPSASATPTPTPTAAPAEDLGPLVPSGDPVGVIGGLPAPWSIAPLADGSVLLSERDEARIVEDVAGNAVTLTEIGDVAPAGEGGLLGLAPLEGADGSWLYAYYTTASDNRVVRMPLSGTPGAHTLGPAEVVLLGLPRASTHNGGRIAFGPDGMLYVTVGDAGQRDLAQSVEYLGGKILRITPQGQVPADNPFAGSPVWSLGHRNPQGIDWAADGTMWAAEFGQDTYDELNIVTPGANYGWPVAEGFAGDGRFTEPIAQWATDDASPSGIAVIGDTVFMAGLGGERLWTITFDGRSQEWFPGAYGRIRDVARGPGNSLYFITNNTDGRGSPRDGDDVLYRVDLTKAA
ncbi:PQQ-dependent sugar dehydrogenase [Cnuibacter sp. UC19_7]|uniref:PQQ-dependent sugar dehydrogenase n=1 Tax=Cnuibacter sp. UC19_7 TaxID=3350166 RepID=UPI00366B5778